MQTNRVHRLMVPIVNLSSKENKAMRNIRLHLIMVVGVFVAAFAQESMAQPRALRG